MATTGGTYGSCAYLISEAGYIYLIGNRKHSYALSLLIFIEK